MTRKPDYGRMLKTIRKQEATIAALCQRLAAAKRLVAINVAIRAGKKMDAAFDAEWQDALDAALAAGEET